MESDNFVSVIIPARNEELNLGACLDSIIIQDGIEFEVIVVDDNSTDRTSEIARAYAGVRVIKAAPLPAGWSGKSYAISKALPYARGNWLLFTDADTIHRPHSIQKAVMEAVEYSADLVSYSPLQVLGSVWERLLQPIIFAELDSQFDYDDVNDPSSTATAANGQYILVRKESYVRAGGHEAIKGELVEDVALARAIKRSGGRLRFRYGPDVVSARMYRNLGELWEGWTKNLAILFPSVLSLALRVLVEFLAIFGGTLVGFLGLFYGSKIIAAVGFGVALISFLIIRKRFKKSGFDLQTTIFSIFGLPVFAALLINSYITTKVLKRSTWKGRTY